MKLQVKAVPGASRSGLAGWLGSALRIRVTAAPERGKANEAIEAVLAEALGIPASHVNVVAGHTSTRKTVEVARLEESVVHERLRRSIAGS